MMRIWPISVLKPISIPGRTRSIYSAIWKNLRNELFIFVVVVVWPGKSEFMGWGISTKLVVSSNVSGNIKQTLWCENPTFTGPSLLSRQGGDSSSSLQWQHAMHEMKRGEWRNEQEGLRIVFVVGQKLSDRPTGIDSQSGYTLMLLPAAQLVVHPGRHHVHCVQYFPYFQTITNENCSNK